MNGLPFASHDVFRLYSNAAFARSGPASLRIVNTTSAASPSRPSPTTLGTNGEFTGFSRSVPAANSPYESDADIGEAASIRVGVAFAITPPHGSPRRTERFTPRFSSTPIGPPGKLCETHAILVENTSVRVSLGNSVPVHAMLSAPHRPVVTCPPASSITASSTFPLPRLKQSIVISRATIGPLFESVTV